VEKLPVVSERDKNMFTDRIVTTMKFVAGICIAMASSIPRFERNIDGFDFPKFSRFSNSERLIRVNICMLALAILFVFIFINSCITLCACFFSLINNQSIKSLCAVCVSSISSSLIPTASSISRVFITAPKWASFSRCLGGKRSPCGSRVCHLFRSSASSTLCRLILRSVSSWSVFRHFVPALDLIQRA